MTLTPKEWDDVLDALDAAGDVLRCDFSALAAKIRAGLAPPGGPLPRRHDAHVALGGSE